MKNNLKKLFSAFKYIKMSYSYFPGKNYGVTPGSYRLRVPLRARPKRGPGAPRRLPKSSLDLRPQLLALQKKSKSMTQTKTRRKVRRRGRIRAGGKEGTSYFVDVMKKQRIPTAVYKSLIGHQGIADESHGYALSTTGQQEAILLPIMLRADLAAIKTIATGGVSTAKTAKIFMKSYVASLHLRNQTNQPCRLKIYDIVCKRDTAGTSLDNPLECWSKGLQDLTGVSTDNYKIPGQVPNRSDEFRTWFKILNVTPVNLNGGDPWIHNINIKMNRMLDTTAVDNGQPTAIQGWTHYVMVVFIGSLSNSTTDNTQVTFCPVKLDYLWTQTIKFAYVEKNTATYTITNRPLTTVTGTLEAMADNGISNLAPTSN